MQLNDLFDEQSIESIAKKTNLAPDVVAKLLGKEFKALKKTQALGALSVIEREYRISLESLREECKSYFADHELSGIGLLPLTPIQKEKRTRSKIFTFLFLAAIFYGAWYFFTAYYKQKIDPSESHSELSLAASALGGNVTLQEKPKEVPSEEIVQELNASNRLEANSSSEEINDTETMSPLSNPIIQDANRSEPNATALGVEVNQTAAATFKRDTITLLPQKAMWFRLIDLKTKKQTEFMRSKKLEVDLRGHDWLFSTENSSFSLIDNNIIEEFSGKKEHYFRFDQDGIHLLSKREFQEALH